MTTTAPGVVVTQEIKRLLDFCQPANFNTETDAYNALRNGLGRIINASHRLTMQRERLRNGDVFYVSAEQSVDNRYRYKVVNEYNDLTIQVATSFPHEDEAASVRTVCTRFLIVELTMPGEEEPLDCLLNPETGEIVLLDPDNCPGEYAPNGPVPSFIQLETQP